MTRGDTILIVITILASLSLGLWITIRLARKVVNMGLRIVVSILLGLMTLVTTLLLIPTNLYLRDKLTYKQVTNPNCDRATTIHVGQYWRSGQSYTLDIENGAFNVSADIIVDQLVSEDKLIGEFCCSADSCRIRFTLDNKDTIFYFNPNDTKRLYVGSSIDREFVVLTNENFGIKI